MIAHIIHLVNAHATDIDQLDEQGYHVSSAWSIRTGCGRTVGAGSGGDALQRIRMHDRNNAAHRGRPGTPVPVGAPVMDRATLAGDIVVADGLPLQRLYARFDEIARGRAAYDS